MRNYICVIAIVCTFYVLSYKKIPNPNLIFSPDTQEQNREICIKKMQQLPDMDPNMSAPDIKMLYEGFSRSKSYFEVGSGSSTFQAVKHGLKVTSVESDRWWYEKMKAIFPTECSINYILIDFHISFNTGYPGPNTTKEEMYQYTHQYKPEYNADMILIDGRFRVACALNILPYISNTTEVYIHDFQRRAYRFVLKYYELVNQTDRLARLRKKACCPSAQELEHYQNETI